MTTLTRTQTEQQALESLLASRAHQRIRNGEATGDTHRLRATLSWQGTGRELRVAPLTDAPWSQVVACLNIWQDAAALAETMPTWVSQVDALVVADGSYTGGGTGPSTDGLTELLAGCPVPVTMVPMLGAAWADQRMKRTALLQTAAHAYPGALLVVLDADEFVSGALRQAPEGDVLWLDVTSPLYARPYSQPRGIRAVPGLRYAGRHHWLYAGDRLLATHQYGGTGVEHRRLAVTLRNARGLGHTPERAAMKRRISSVQWQGEAPATTGAVASDQAVGAREALRILQTTTYDAGMVGYRLHTAINVTTPHVSAFAAMGSRNAYGSPLQYDLNAPDDLLRCALLAAECDVLHCHLDYAPMRLLDCHAPLVVIHHHGSMYRKNAALLNALDADHAGLRLVSNLELTQYGDGLHFLPNPMPVARYQRLRTQTRKADIRDGFRVAHSPSRRDYKGTEVFLAACDRLNTSGLTVVPVLIEHQTHAESLAIKATCHAAFDSFWLGLQCSGLEAAAMGLPVIAGDAFVAGKYREWLGAVPYTYAADEAGLVDALARLVTDAEFYRTEAERVAAYTVTHHDEAAVALRYLDLLDQAVQWRDRLKVAA